jgi:hypothetical protein
LVWSSFLVSLFVLAAMGVAGTLRVVGWEDQIEAMSVMLVELAGWIWPEVSTSLCFVVLSLGEFDAATSGGMCIVELAEESIAKQSNNVGAAELQVEETRGSNLLPCQCLPPPPCLHPWLTIPISPTSVFESKQQSSLTFIEVNYVYVCRLTCPVMQIHDSLQD